MTQPLTLKEQQDFLLNDLTQFLVSKGWSVKRENIDGGTAVLEHAGRRVVMGAHVYALKDGAPIVKTQTVRFPIMGEWVERTVETTMPDRTEPYGVQPLPNSVVTEAIAEDEPPLTLQGFVKEPGDLVASPTDIPPVPLAEEAN